MKSLDNNKTGYQIYSGIPCPVRTRLKERYPFALMTVGQCFFVEIGSNTRSKPRACALYSAAKKFRDKYNSSFRISIKITDSNKIGVWRVK